MPHACLIQFAARVRADRRANPASGADGTALELLIAPRFRELLEEIRAERLPAGPRILPEYTRAGIGRPDLAFAHPNSPPRAFIELKAPDKSIVERQLRGHDKDQFRRFRELPVWALTNFHAIHLYRRGTLQDQAVILPAAALDPATPDTTAERLIRRHDPSGFLTIFDTLALAQPLAPRSAREVAEVLAHAARLVRAVVADLCRAGPPPALATVRADFRETLFAHAAAGGYNTEDEDTLFAIAFAQTLVFGLLLARETGDEPLDRHAYRRLPEGAYPLLRATLRALTLDEILPLLGVAFDVVLDTVNAIDRTLLVPRGGHDPILYFYEDFLSVFDPDARRRHGVFFTPVPVVRFMVAATDRALRQEMRTGGLLDRNVLLLDPACGTGTFLIATADHCMQAARATFGEGSLAGEMASLAARLHGFELLVGPYTVAHYRMLRELAAVGAQPNRRLPIFLADTLAPPRDAAGITAHLGFLAGPIVEERRDADALKRDTPIIAILGNPPYRRLEAGEEEGIVSGWDSGFWDDLKQPVRDAGWGNDLGTFPELSVAFWRWCIWKLFESEGAPGQGLVCLITNRTFLAGRPYAGLRRMLRRRFDLIEIVDLRGDLRGARPAGIERDEGVFAIQTGVCILTAIARGRERPPTAEARVRYADAWRHSRFTEREKLDWVTAAQNDPAAIVFSDCNGADLDDFVPRGFVGLDWPTVRECFAFGMSGVKTQRDDLVYGHSIPAVETAIGEFLAAENVAAWRRFFPLDNEVRARRILRTSTSALKTAERVKVGQFRAARAQAFELKAMQRRAYRPLDVRHLYARENYLSRHRPELRAAWGAENICLYALPGGTGAGPAVWAHGLLPDYHAFRGSYGGYAFPLWDRRQGPAAHNLAPALLLGLSAAYGEAIAADQAFDAMLGLLSAAS